MICHYLDSNLYDFLNNYCLYYFPAIHRTLLSRIRMLELCLQNWRSKCLNSKRVHAEEELRVNCSFWCYIIWFWTFSECNRLMLLQNIHYIYIFALELVNRKIYLCRDGMFNLNLFFLLEYWFLFGKIQILQTIYLNQRYFVNSLLIIIFKKS